MIAIRAFRRVGSALTIAALITIPRLASAVTLDHYVSTIEQWGTGSAFYLGHTVIASTSYNNLVAGGTYIAQCNHPATLPVAGERTLSSGTLGVGLNILYVTVPQNLPALANISGWAQVTADTELSCNYRWTAHATESGYSIGAGGITFQTGNGTRRDGGTVDFAMYRGLTPQGGGGCGP